MSEPKMITCQESTLDAILDERDHLRSVNGKLLRAARMAREYLKPNLVEPGRTVFWALVDAIEASEPPTEPKV